LKNMNLDLQTSYSRLFDDLTGRPVECEMCGSIMYVNDLIYEAVWEKDLKYFICKKCFDGEDTLEIERDV